jgi:hypothetical protein
MKGGRKNCDKKRHTGGTVTMNQNPVSLTYDWDTEWGKATAVDYKQPGEMLQLV